MATVLESRIAARVNHPLRWCLNGFLIFWLITASGAIFPVLTIGGEGIAVDEAARGNLRLLLLPSIVMAPLLVLARFRAVLRLAMRNPFLILLLIWTALSIVWSLSPDVTARRVITLLVNSMIVCFLVVDRDVEQLLKLLSWCFLILLVTSVAFILLRPDLGFMPDGRGLRGAFTHKNPMGETIVLSIIVFFAALRSGVISRWMGFLGMGLALVLLVPVGAASSIVVAGIIITMQVYFLTDSLSIRLRLVLLAFGVSVLSAAIGLTLANLDIVLDVLGRDATLTGRTDIWAYVLQVSAERPWLGYGYTSYFEVERIANYVIERFGWPAPSAHNGYLEIVLGLGWTGLILLLCFFATMIYRFMVRWHDHTPATFMFVLPMLTLTLTFNLTESNLLTPNGLSWIVLLIAALILTPGLLPRR